MGLRIRSFPSDDDPEQLVAEWRPSPQHEAFSGVLNGGIVGTLGLERPTLVGQSFGGNVALQYAADHPGEVSHLVLVDGGFIEPQLREGATWEAAESQMAPPDLRMPVPAFVDRLRSRRRCSDREAAGDHGCEERSRCAEDHNRRPHPGFPRHTGSR